MHKPRPALLSGVARTLVAASLAATALSAMTGVTMAKPISSILFVNPLPQYPAWRLIGDCVAAKAKEFGIPSTESGPTDGTLNTTQMFTQIQQGIANSAGAIITFPASDGFVPILQQAKAADIMVGTLYGAAGTEAASDVNVGANFTTVGEIFAASIAEREGSQNVGLMVQGPTGSGKAFVEGFTAAAAKTDNVKVIAVVNTNDDASKALDQANALLTAHPEINVIASHMGSATQGGVSAIRQRDLVGKVVFVANGAAGGGKEGLSDGTVHRLMMQDLCNAGGQVVEGLVKQSKGESVSKQVDVGVQMFGAEGIEDYIAKGWQ
jgi:ABC-type sugar transport system substrate-binding protein